jgi:hypothetical protein
MTIGFSAPKRVARLKAELTRWTLYQVAVDKFHVMFWFENGHCLLNVAFRFDLRNANGQTQYVYDVQADGDRKALNVDGILRCNIAALSDRQLAITFDSGEALVIHDSPDMRSVWFYRYDPLDHNAACIWFEEDELGEAEL